MPIIHGNGGSIGTMAARIAAFRLRHRVIAMDSRDQGKSGDGPGGTSWRIRGWDDGGRSVPAGFFVSR